MEVDGGPECTICLQSLQRGIATLPCGHVFHRDCISQWFTNGHNGQRGRSALSVAKDCPCCKRTYSASQIIPLHYEGYSEPNGQLEIVGVTAGANSMTDDIMYQNQIRGLQSGLWHAEQERDKVVRDSIASRQHYEQALANLATRLEDTQWDLTIARRATAAKEREATFLARRVDELKSQNQGLEDRLVEKQKALEEAESSMSLVLGADDATVPALLKAYTTEWLKSHILQGPVGEKKVLDTLLHYGKRYTEVKRELKTENENSEQLQVQVNKQRQQLLEFDAKVKELQKSKAGTSGSVGVPSKRKHSMSLDVDLSVSDRLCGMVEAAPKRKPTVTTGGGKGVIAPASHPFVVRNAFAPLGASTVNVTARPIVPQRSFLGVGPKTVKQTFGLANISKLSKE